MEITFKEYCMEVGEILDNYFMPGKEWSDEFFIVFRKNLPSYYSGNIASEMAAEFIAQQLGLTRRTIN